MFRELAESFASSPAGYITGIFAVPTLTGVLLIARYLNKAATTLREIQHAQANDSTARAALANRVDKIETDVTEIRTGIAVMRDRFERGTYPVASGHVDPPGAT